MWGINCGTWTALFVGAVVAVGLGNLVGYVAWRSRAADQPFWRAFVGFKYLFKPEYYSEPLSKTRLLATVLVLAGAAAIVAVSVAIVTAELSGMPSFCGLGI